jgi:hypothetical protein
MSDTKPAGSNVSAPNEPPKTHTTDNAGDDRQCSQPYYDNKGKLHLEGYKGRIPSGPPSHDRLVDEIALQEAISNASLVALLRKAGGWDGASDEEILADIEKNSEWLEETYPNDVFSANVLKQREAVVDAAIGRTTSFHVDSVAGVPVLPEEVYGSPVLLPNLIRLYLELVEPVSESPRSFHLGSFMAALGAATARRSYYVWGVKKVYLNIWTLLLGSTALGKGDGADYGLLLLRDLSQWLSDRRIQTIEDFKSVPALFLAMRDGSTSHPTLYYADEISALLGRSSMSRDIMSALNTVYNSRDEQEYRTKEGSIFLHHVFLGALACGTVDQIPGLITKEIRESGFVNRWSVFLGGSVKPNPLPPKLDLERWGSFVRILAERLYHAEGEMHLTEQATKLYKRWYSDRRSERHSKEQSDVTARVTMQAQKYACLYAILEGSTEVNLGHVRSGVILSLYNVACMNVVEPGIGGTVKRSREEEARLWLEKQPGHRGTFRNLHRKLRGNAKEVAEAVEGLVQAGYVKVHGPVAKGNVEIELIRGS